MNNYLTISVKEASEISKLPAYFIRKQVENGIIPMSYSINHKYRKTYIIYRKPFIKWLNDLRGFNE